MPDLAFKIKRRLKWYKARFQVNNPVVGRAVELLGDRVWMDGLTYSVSTPQITRGHKSTLAFGLHEIEERELIRRWLPSNVPVLEFGGGLGVVSCLANRKLDRREQHIVVEANPAMISILQRNRDLNGCKFRIINKAIAYDCDRIDLNVDSGFVGSTAKPVALGTSVSVETTTVQSLLDEAGFEQAGIVCDIEGVEADVVDREVPMLGKRIRYIMAEMHPKILGADVVDGVMRKLGAAGFSLKQQIGDCVFLSR
jgi:FkbM family methyltransferase